MRQKPIKTDRDYIEMGTANKVLDDMGAIIQFYISLCRAKNYRKYIKELGYVSHMEKTHRFIAWN